MLIEDNDRQQSLFLMFLDGANLKLPEILANGKSKYNII